MKPSGKLILNLQRSMMDVLLLVEKQLDGTASGRVLPINGSFMPLHDGNGRSSRHRLPSGPIEPVILTNASFQPTALQQKDFAFFLQCHLPQASYHRISQANEIIHYLKDGERLLQFSHNTIRGSVELWSELQAITESFEHLNHPKRYDFTFSYDHDGHQYLQYQDQRWMIAP
jgi:hypothetical protein